MYGISNSLSTINIKHDINTRIQYFSDCGHPFFNTLMTVDSIQTIHAPPPPASAQLNPLHRLCPNLRMRFNNFRALSMSIDTPMIIPIQSHAPSTLHPGQFHDKPSPQRSSWSLMNTMYITQLSPLP